MTPYHKLSNWWGLCDAIRGNMDDEFPRMVLAEYVEENGHHELAQGIRDAWRERYKYYDEYEYEAATPRNGSYTLKVDFHSGFVSSVSCPHPNMLRRKLGELVRANIVLFAQVETKHAAKRKDGRYAWLFRDREKGLPMYQNQIDLELKNYMDVAYGSDREATNGLSRALISRAIDQNCDGTEGKFLSRNQGANIMIASRGTGRSWLGRTISQMYAAPVPPPIASAEFPSDDPA